jgi:hypothetical protein
MLAANPFLAELWERVVSNHHGGKLPFGRLWDEVLGLARWVASWNSPSGRKGELIQTHYFAKAFGERIQSAGTVPQVDYFLLPTISELLDPANSLALFPSFSRLLALAEAFQSSFCVLHTVAGITLSRFKNPGTGQFDGEKLQNLFRQLSPSLTPSGIECYNAFNREPGRTTCFLMMLADLRAGRFSPAAITPVQFGLLQDGLEKTYFYPKALQIYAQQSWGNSGAMPADTWITGFMSRTLQAPRTGNRGQYVDWPAVFGACSRLGKVERLLWVASQARKVHSSACDDALWCLKIASNRVERGPNPLSCAICSPSIVGKCPAFAAISGLTVRFNANSPTGAAFEIQTSAGNNTTAGQGFVRSTTLEPLTVARDDFSPIDRPHGYQTFPNPAHGGAPITVAQFQQFYRK